MSRRRKRRTPSAFVIVIVLVLLLGVIAIVVSRDGGDGEGEGIVTAAVDIDGDALGPPGTGRDPELGKRAPALRGIDFAGRAVAIEPGRRPTAIVFLAHWCPHCQAEVEALSSWLVENEFPEGVDVFAVSTLVDEARGNYPPGEWLSGFPVRTLVDDEESSAADAYGLQGTPFWVFLDEDGNVDGRAGGTIEPEALHERLERLVRAG